MKNNVKFPIKVNSGKSIGKLQLGMTHEEILRAIHEMRMDWGDLNESDVEITKDMEFDGLQCVRYMCFADGCIPFFFIVTFRDDTAVEIGISKDVDLYHPVVYPVREMQHLPLFQLPADLLIAYLKTFGQCIADNDDELLANEYVFPELGLTLWRENAFHSKLLLDQEYMEMMGDMVTEEFGNVFFEIVKVSVCK